MRSIVCLSLVAVFCASAHAELQNVEIDGDVRVRWRANLNYRNGPAGPGPGGSIERIPGFSAYGRPIGDTGFFSRYMFDDKGIDRVFAEMRARLGLRADFTDGVSSYIQLESYDRWGEDFRSNWVTGADGRAVSTNDVELLQAYIQVSEMWGTPLQLRVGRQQIRMGKGWLVGSDSSGLSGTPFDAVRLTYDVDDFTVDAWWGKVAETFAAERDGDTDFYGVYGTYTGFEPLSLSAYWLMVRDASAANDTTLGPIGEWVEDALGLDDYDPTYLHTIGLRLFGSSGAWDYDWELAYQFGEADQIGTRFPLVGGIYGDTDAEFGAFGTDIELGYTFDVKMAPRLYIGGAVYEGEDNRDRNIFERLNPFARSEASIAFNRLFAHSTMKYSFIIDGGQVLSNFMDLRAGVELNPTDKTELGFEIEKFWADETVDLPHFFFFSRESDDDLGWQSSIWGRYHYSEDLWIRFRWEHLFTGEGFRDGNYTDLNGLYFMRGSDDDDSDYIEVMTGIQF